jgi:hypothetical protein
MFFGQGGTATLRNHRCLSRAVIVGGEPISTGLSGQVVFSGAVCRTRRLAVGGNSQAGRPRQAFFVRGGLTFRGVKWRWGGVWVSPLRQFPV